MVAPLTTTSYAILGLLALRTWTSYELTKQVRRSLSWFWPRAERKLYEEPKRLVAAGLATATPSTTGKRPRTVYAITEEGRAALARWLDEPSAPRSSEFEAVVKVFFADAGTREQLTATLQRIGVESADRVERLGALTTTVVQEAPFPHRLHLNALTVRLQLEQELAVLRWAGWAQDQVEQWHEAGDPGAWDALATLTEVESDARRSGTGGRGTSRAGMAVSGSRRHQGSFKSSDEGWRHDHHPDDQPGPSS